MARIIVMPDASHLTLGIRGTVLYAENVWPEHLDDLRSSEQILERLEKAVREAGAATRPRMTWPFAVGRRETTI
jgi:hypothetical protein